MGSGRNKNRPSELMVRYVEVVNRRPWAVVLPWAIISIFGLVYGTRLFSSTSMTMSPPSGSTSAIAEQTLVSNFPGVSTASPLLVVLKRLDGRDLLGTPGLDEFACALNRSVVDYIAGMPGGDILYPGDGPKVVSYTSLGCPNEPINNTTAYRGLPWCKLLAKQFFNANYGIVGLPLQGGAGSGPPGSAFSSWLVTKIKKLLSARCGEGVTAEVTGNDLFASEMITGIEQDLTILDLVSLPLAFGVLALILRAARLLVIPLVNIVAGALVSYLIVYGMSTEFEVFSVAPSLMTEAVLAMSIDYSMFLLSRYREELEKRRPPQVAIVTMLWFAGHTVVISGSTLIACCLSLVIFPTAALSTAGIACAVAIFVAIVANVTITPAMLLMFPRFFAKSVQPSRLLDWCCCTRRDATRSRSPADYDGIVPPRLGIQADSDDDINLDDDVALLRDDSLDTDDVMQTFSIDESESQSQVVLFVLFSFVLREGRFFSSGHFFCETAT